MQAMDRVPEKYRSGGGEVKEQTEERPCHSLKCQNYLHGPPWVCTRFSSNSYAQPYSLLPTFRWEQTASKRVYPFWQTQLTLETPDNEVEKELLVTFAGVVSTYADLAAVRACL